ncbi:hypothetical protein HELRODRAFT_161947 [Helobdella robusta]|uniref:Ig-like domain-containing protein n=1 Tax=Helobdella robusta TaxID=6412 RepID=T1ES24_HELRO|nr:hypothetical protein HELRODRAFT_161947 [Helobdella robusta]ESO02657.1 hypothetical protein HELRODRAFT_161947 [Helobdella robusta]
MSITANGEKVASNTVELHLSYEKQNCDATLYYSTPGLQEIICTIELYGDFANFVYHSKFLVNLTANLGNTATLFSTMINAGRECVDGAAYRCSGSNVSINFYVWVCFQYRNTNISEANGPLFYRTVNDLLYLHWFGQYRCNCSIQNTDIRSSLVINGSKKCPYNSNNFTIDVSDGPVWLGKEIVLTCSVSVMFPSEVAKIKMLWLSAFGKHSRTRLNNEKIIYKGSVTITAKYRKDSSERPTCGVIVEEGNEILIENYTMNMAELQEEGKSTYSCALSRRSDNLPVKIAWMCSYFVDIPIKGLDFSAYYQASDDKLYLLWDGVYTCKCSTIVENYRRARVWPLSSKTCPFHRHKAQIELLFSRDLLIMSYTRNNMETGCKKEAWRFLGSSSTPDPNQKSTPYIAGLYTNSECANFPGTVCYLAVLFCDLDTTINVTRSAIEIGQNFTVSCTASYYFGGNNYVKASLTLEFVELPGPVKCHLEYNPATQKHSCSVVQVLKSRSFNSQIISCTLNVTFFNTYMMTKDRAEINLISKPMEKLMIMLVEMCENNRTTYNCSTDGGPTPKRISWSCEKINGSKINSDDSKSLYFYNDTDLHLLEYGQYHCTCAAFKIKNLKNEEQKLEVKEVLNAFRYEMASGVGRSWQGLMIGGFTAFTLGVVGIILTGIYMRLSRDDSHGYLDDHCDN